MLVAASIGLAARFLAGGQVHVAQPGRTFTKQHRGLSVLAVAADPAAHGCDRDLEPLRGSAFTPAVVHDAAGQAQPAGRGQRGVSVGYEDLRVCGADAVRQLHTSLGGPHPCRAIKERVADG